MEAQNKLSKSISEKQQLEIEVKNLTEQLTNQQIEFEQVQMILEDTQKKLESSKVEHTILVNELKSQFDGERSDLEQEIEEKNQEMKVLNESWEAKLELSKDSKIEIEKLTKEIDQLKQQLKEECTKVDTFKQQGMIDRQQTRDKFEQQITTFKTQIQSLEKELEGKTSSNESERSELLAKVTALENDFNESKKSCNKLTRDNSKLTTDNNSMMLDLFENKEFLNSNKEKIESLTAKVKELENQACNSKSSDGEIKAAQSKIIELSKELTTCQQQYNDSIMDCDLMSRKIRELEFELADCRKEVTKLKAKCKQIENESGIDKEQKNKELIDTKEELARRVLEIQTLTKANQEMESMRKSSKTSEETMKEQLEGEKQKNQALENEIKSLKELINKPQEFQQKGMNESIQGEEIAGNKTSTHPDVKVVSQSNGIEELTSTHSEVENVSQSQDKEEKYSSSFDDDDSSSSRSSSSSATSTTISSKSDSDGKNDRSKDNQIKDDQTSRYLTFLINISLFFINFLLLIIKLLSPLFCRCFA